MLYNSSKIADFVIGIGGQLDTRVSPSAVFLPEPDQPYQIQPVLIFFVTVGDHSVGAPVPSALGETCEVNFADNNEVNILHNQLGKLQIE